MGKHVSQSNTDASGGYRPAFTPGSQSKAANDAFAHQAHNIGEYSRNSSAYKYVPKQKTKGKRVIAAVLAAVLLLALGGGTAFALYINKVNNDLAGGKTQTEQKEIVEALAPVAQSTDPFYMMLIGSDQREADASMGERADTNILVYVDPKQSLITLVSIPRDTKIEIAGYGTNKFNAAYTYGGTAGTIKEASKLTGVDISHYAEVNFGALIELVDAVGGIEVDVPELIDDPEAGPVVLQPGLQTLNGEAALVFSRSRAYADGDFTRTSNQRLVVEALIDKVLSLSATEIPSVIEKVAKCVSTDMTVSDLVNLALQFKDLGNLKIYSAMVPSVTAMINDISYVITDTEALEEMMKLVVAGKDPSTVVASASVYQDSDASGYSSEGTNTYSYEAPNDGTNNGNSYSGSGYQDPTYIAPTPPDEPQDTPSDGSNPGGTTGEETPDPNGSGTSAGGGSTTDGTGSPAGSATGSAGTGNSSLTGQAQAA